LGPRDDRVHFTGGVRAALAACVSVCAFAARPWGEQVPCQSSHRARVGVGRRARRRGRTGALFNQRAARSRRQNGQLWQAGIQSSV